ncbi:hypothetical protein [Chryseobacterium sp. Marseille-Q8038]
MSIKKMYYYLFYKLYKHYENSSEPWLSNWKAGVSIGILEIWLLLSIGNYFLITTNKTVHLNLLQPIVIIPVTIVFIFNYLSFDYKDTWKKYNEEFDQLSRDQNKKGGVIIWSIIILIITNMIFSYLLLLKSKNKSYRTLF